MTRTYNSKMTMNYFLSFIAIFLLLSACSDKEIALSVDVDPEISVSDSIIEIDGIEYQISKQEIASVVKNEKSIFYDFGNDAFSQITIEADGHDGDTLRIYIGECADGYHVDTIPGVFRRTQKIAIPLEDGIHIYKPQIARTAYAGDIRALRVPDAIGEVLPFRYVEIENNENCIVKGITRFVVTCPFTEDASYFESDNQLLNKVWDFCKYSVKATSFLGYYVDGDRERRPYEADALINQLCHYAVDSYYPVARRTCDYLLDHPTWPTEWIMQTILIAWYDYLYSGDISLLTRRYDLLKSHTLQDLLEPANMLICTTNGQPKSFLNSLNLKNEITDIVDWPHSEVVLGQSIGGEDDGYEYMPYNTVVNAYHYEAVKTMAKIANAIGNQTDYTYYSKYASDFLVIFNNSFFDKSRHVYIDGVGSSHASLHANMFPLAFGLVPEGEINKVADFVCSRGMSCSVYGSQFLLDALYNAGRDDVALDYMTNTSNRSWYNMMREGSTITMEAWGNKWKPDQDWNHAWGAAPANIIPFRLLGVRPISKGFDIVEIKPQLGSLNLAKGRIPTPKGGIEISAQRERLTIALPANIKAIVKMQVPDYPYVVKVNGKNVKTTELNGFVEISEFLMGNVDVMIKKR